MSFLAPTALWWLLVAAPVAALFFFRRRVIEVIVPAIQFWEPLPSRTRFGRIGPYLRRRISLMLHLLVVVLLALAMARPSCSGPVQQFAFVIDDSATMQTREADGRTRFQLAVDELKQRAYAKADSVHVCVVGAGDPPRVLVRSTDDPTRVALAMEHVQPRDVGPAIDNALALARRISPGESVTPVLITDQPVGTFDRARVGEYVRIGTERPNLAISDATLAADENAIDVFLTQQGMTDKTIDVQLLANKQPLAKELVELVGERVSLRLRPGEIAGQPFEIVATPGDSFDLDNQFFGVWPDAGNSRMQLVSAGSISLLAALDQPEYTLTQTQSGSWRKTPADVTVLDNVTAGPDKPIPGRFIVLGGHDPFGLTRDAEPVEDIAPTQWAPDSPYLKDVDLMAWRIRRTAGFDAPLGSHVLVQSGNTPLLFAVTKTLEPQAGDPTFVALYANFALRDTNLERRASLAILLWNAIDALRGRRTGDAAISHVTGSPVSFVATPGVDADVTTPSGRRATYYRDGDRVVLPFPQEAGIYEMKSSKQTERRAVNYIGPSHRGVAGSSAVTLATVDSGVVAELSRRPPWMIAVVLVVIAATVEFLAFHFRVLRID